MENMFITGVLLVVTFGTLLMIKMLWRFRRSYRRVRIPFDQLKARELEKR